MPHPYFTVKHGELHWKARHGGKTDALFNSKYAGRRAGYYRDGVRYVKINGFEHPYNEILERAMK